MQDNNPTSASPVPSSPSPLATDEVTWYNDRGENPSEIVLQCEVLPHGSSTPITLEAAADLVTNGVDNIYAKSNCGDGNIPLTSGLSGMAGGVQNWNATWHDVDAPASGTLGNDMSYAELGASFDDYLMYKPPDETYNFKPSIWISLGHFNWSFTANSTNANGWSQPATTYSTPGPAPSLDTAIPVPSFPNNC